MGLILLGHGSLDLDPDVTPPDMEIVGIPRGTTLQFFADAGQGLVFDHVELDVWEQLRAPWPPLDSNNVTYNLSVESAAEIWDDALRNDPQLGGHQLVRPGVGGFPDPLRLCTGTRRTCPTSTEQVAAGARHKCRGVLGRFHGQDLYWLACTFFKRADPAAADAATAGRSASVLLGQDPDWVPDRSDLEAIERVNRANVEGAGDGESLHYVLGGSAFLIGDGHTRRHEMFARHQDDSVDGWCDVYRGTGGAVSGGFDVWNVPEHQQLLVGSALVRFSGAEVRFI